MERGPEAAMPHAMPNVSPPFYFPMTQDEVVKEFLPEFENL